MNERELKTNVTQALGLPRLRRDVWDELKESGWVESTLEGLNGGWDTTEIQDLAAEYRAIDVELGGTAERQHSLGADRRTRALSRILVERAAREESVIAFRREELDDRLLTMEELDPWIEQQMAAQTGVRMERIVLPAGVHGFDPFTQDEKSYADWLEEVARAAREQELRPTVAETGVYALLEYAKPGERVAGNIPVDPGSTLDRLREVTEMLAARYQWRKALAVLFVVCGYEPQHSTAVVTTKRRPLPALDRIAVEVDPRLSALELGRIYTAHRLPHWQERDREMHDKHLALAVFTELHRDDGETWPQRRERWNREICVAQPRLGFDEPHPEWKFKPGSDAAARGFATACRNAWTHVTGLSWRRAETETSS